jgi:hypothetical protein
MNLQLPRTRQVLAVKFFYTLVYNAVPTASNGRMTDERTTGKDLEGSFHGLYSGNSWWDGRKS